MLRFGICFIVLVFLVRENEAQCNYVQQMEMNFDYYIYNPTYPNYYQGELHCTWRAVVQQSSQIRINCITELPGTDRLQITVAGYNNSDIYTSGSFSQTYSTKEMNIYFDSIWNTRGGRFYCQLTALGVSPPVTPPPCDCGWKQGTRIVGGVETNPNEFPFMAGIVDVLTAGTVVVRSEIICGGTIISERYVMTAAHCITSSERSRLALVIGEHNTESGNDTQATTIHFIESFIVHENFNPTTMQNDIALILTRTAIAFSNMVGPACLPYTLWVSDGSFDVTVLGWGSMEFSGPTSNTLQKVDLATITQQECVSRRPEVQSTQLCTFTPGKDACQYDSGGPAVWFDPTRQRYKSVGVVSYGNGCADSHPGVYTRVQSYINWIERVTGGGFCRK